MTVRELVAELLECNQDARVDVVIGDEDMVYYESYNLHVHCKDVFEYVELFVPMNTVQIPKLINR